MLNTFFTLLFNNKLYMSAMLIASKGSHAQDNILY